MDSKFPEAVTAETPSTSSLDYVDRQEDMEIHVEEHCLACGETEASSTKKDWIWCHGCNNWYHRICAGIFNIKKYKALQMSECNWNCKECKKMGVLEKISPEK